MEFPRVTGILLHPTSLPARGGIGDLGPAAYEFADFLAAARQGVWQILPLVPLTSRHSPYSSTSAFAGNTLLISLQRLSERSWISPAEIEADPELSGRIHYEEVIAWKTPLLEKAAQHFLQGAAGRARERFDQFCLANQWWLEDFVLFDALRQRYGPSWDRWPSELARREASALNRMRHDLAPDLNVRRALQFMFFEQWGALRQYCARKSIRMVGDIPVFVDYDSADVWAQRDLFRLRENLEPEVVSGVPPDAFSETGQRWGNPLYRWDVMKERGYRWWVDRMRWTAHNVDYVRLDHFRGFDQFWEIPADQPTAINGRWVDGPRDDLFLKIREALGGLPFFAEDLGYITESVHALRQRLNIPRMAVLQFGFSNPGAHTYLPHRLTPDTVVYTGTHDNDTAVGWWTSGATAYERAAALSYLGDCSDGIHWALIRAAQASVANLSVVPMQDILGLGSEARMNVPSRIEDNWHWCMKPGAATREAADKLARMAEVTDRLPQPVSCSQEEFVV
jgi:4-alpha-glucanotransferase